MIDAVDVALISALQNDATLAPMLPGGVHRDFEPESATGGRCARSAGPFFQTASTSTPACAAAHQSILPSFLPSCLLSEPRYDALGIGERGLRPDQVVERRIEGI